MKVSCQCGALVASIADDAEPTVIMCHCIDCQRRSGSPFGAIAYFPAGAVNILGEAREYSRTADSGHAFTNGFCPACGSTVYARSGRAPDVVGITVGAIADPAFPPPVRSVYEQSRHAWIAVPERASRHPRGRDS